MKYPNHEKEAVWPSLKTDFPEPWTCWDLEKDDEGATSDGAQAQGQI